MIIEYNNPEFRNRYMNLLNSEIYNKWRTSPEYLNCAGDFMKYVATLYNFTFIGTSTVKFDSEADWIVFTLSVKNIWRF